MSEEKWVLPWYYYQQQHTHVALSSKFNMMKDRARYFINNIMRMEYGKAWERHKSALQILLNGLEVLQLLMKVHDILKHKRKHKSRELHVEVLQLLTSASWRSCGRFEMLPLMMRIWWRRNPLSLLIPSWKIIVKFIRLCRVGNDERFWAGFEEHTWVIISSRDVPLKCLARWKAQTPDSFLDESMMNQI